MKDTIAEAKRWFQQGSQDLEPDALPGAIPSEAFDDNDANSAISMANKIMEFVQLKIG